MPETRISADGQLIKVGDVVYVPADIIDVPSILYKVTITEFWDENKIRFRPIHMITGYYMGARLDAVYVDYEKALKHHEQYL